MLKRFYNKKAQANFGEYLLTLFLVVGMMTGMTIYVKRALQARYYDARNTMVQTVRDEAAGYYIGEVRTEYEPYYANTEATVERDILSKTELFEGTREKSAGIFKKTFNEMTSVQVLSETKPPKDSD